MHRRVTALVLLVAATATGSAAEPPWRLVWEDTFSGESLDWTKWEIEVNAFGGGNHELQIYTDRTENVRVEGGMLVIEAHRGRHGIAGTERDFSSGRIRSKRRGDWLYGRIEARAKVPRGRGLWPAFWMLPSDDTHGGWAASGEIDILEIKGQEPEVLWGTIHHGAPWPDNRHTGIQYRLPRESFADGFHVFGIEWERGRITWLIDGEPWQTQEEWSSTGGPFPAPFDHPFHVILNLAVGGGFVGPPADDTPFPARFEIDWVRVWQRTGSTVAP